MSVNFLESWYFFILIGLAIGVGVYIIRKIIFRQWRLKNALQMERIRRKETEALNQTKQQFFTNISHELRTPLTLILGPLEQLLASHNLPVKEREQIREIHRNSEKLERLITQLLDFTKVGSGKMTLNAQPVEIIQFIREVITPFTDFARRYGIVFQVKSSIPHLQTELDVEKLDKILYNLLSNAFKFTPKGGSVELSVEVSTASESDGKSELIFIIKDTGVGIPLHQQAHIFERFFQANQEQYLKQSGTGIGLALTKDLVELHGGRLSLESKEGKGSVFTVCIPLVKIPNDISSSIKSVVLADVKDPARLSRLRKTVSTSLLNKSKPTQPTILIIEDDPEVRKFIQQCLNDEYQIETAADGVAGLMLATQLAPDMIISDVMMPRMDGLELCAKLKTDIHTSHIPVILLTARANFESQLKGLKIGADDYLFKPFSPQLLIARIQNLITTRNRLRMKFGQLLEIDPENFTHSSSDERFLQLLLDIVTNRLGDSQFSVKELASDTGMSHSVLYRKIKALTGLTAKEFIVNLRLKHAAKLLKTQDMNVSEVAFAVGFNDPKYFSTVFRKHFNMSPTQFLIPPSINQEKN